MQVLSAKDEPQGSFVAGRGLSVKGSHRMPSPCNGHGNAVDLGTVAIEVEIQHQREQEAVQAARLAKESEQAYTEQNMDADDEAPFQPIR